MSTRERDTVVVGWDGRSQPMLRYADEMHLPDSQRSVVAAAASHDAAEEALPEGLRGASGLTSHAWNGSVVGVAWCTRCGTTMNGANREEGCRWPALSTG
jgi:hypothetical protein